LDTLELRARELPLFGQVREGRLFGRRAMTSEARFGCWRAGGGDDPVWEVETDAPEDSVSVGQRSVVTHSRDGHFCVRSMDDGRLQWRLATDQTWESHRPWLVLDSVAVQVEDEQRLAAYDLATGAPAWRRTTDGTWSNLVATNGFIWTAREVATNRHEVVALRSADGDEAWKLALPEPAPRCLLALAGGSLLCDLKRRVTAWRGAGARPA
jgi:outer membrane protein assembly factor BamB